MNLPNRLTVLRIVMSVVFVLLLLIPSFLNNVLAFIVFTIACLTDFYDGYLARKYNLITDLGKILDPIADKILILSSFLIFVEKGIIPAWMVILILLRESVITAIRFYAAKKGKILAASKWGKQKTVSQMVSIFLILGVLIYKEACLSIWKSWSATLEFRTSIIIYIFMLITVVLTLLSGLFYLLQNKEIFIYAENN